MKLGPVTKLDKTTEATSKNFDDDVMSANFDVIVIFLFYNRFRTIRKPDFGRIVCETQILINSNVLSYTN